MPISVSISVKLPNKRMFDGKLFVEALEKQMQQKTVPALTGMFEKTVEGWDDKPSFKSSKIHEADRIGVRVYASGGRAANIYRLVNNGAPAHEIASGKLGFLLFRPGYSSSTRPRILGSRAKRRFGNYIFPQVVNHPGFEAREFDQTIADAHYPDFVRDMQEVFRNPIFLEGSL